MKKFLLVVISAMGGAAISAVCMNMLMKKRINTIKNMSDKFYALFRLQNQWVKVKQENKSIVSYLHDNAIKSVAIYGMSFVGERLLKELENSDIEVKYAIDKNADRIYTDIEVVTPEEKLDEVDAIIVTPVFFYNEIAENLSGKVDSEIISIEDILYDI